jgi:hypothetical protein
LPGRRLTPATSPAIWRHFRLAAGSPDGPSMKKYWALEGAA